MRISHLLFTQMFAEQQNGTPKIPSLSQDGGRRRVGPEREARSQARCPGDWNGHLWGLRMGCSSMGFRNPGKNGHQRKGLSVYMCVCWTSVCVWVLERGDNFNWGFQFIYLRHKTVTFVLAPSELGQSQMQSIVCLLTEV